MTHSQRPVLSLPLSSSPIVEFVQRLQQAIDGGDADLFNSQFAEDVLWGSPFGAVAEGYPQIHAIHERMFASVVPVKGASRYHVEHVRFVSAEVAVAYVRRLSAKSEAPDRDKPGSFDELAMLVLVERAGSWWLAAAQHVPDFRHVYSTPKPS